MALFVVPQTEFEKTRFYKDVVKIGERKGEKRGEIKGEIRGEIKGQIRLTKRKV